VVAARRTEKADAVLDGATLWVSGPEIKAPDAGKGNRCRAHGTGLQRHVKVGVVEPIRAAGRASRPDCQHLGVRGGIGQAARAVVGAHEDAAIGHQQGADGHFPTCRRGLGFLQCHPHIALIGPSCHKGKRLLDRTLREHCMRKSPPGQRRLAAPPAAGWPMRVAKAMARAGLCSRREAERWIEQGRVRVNGTLLRSPARDVSERDHITVDNAPLPSVEPPRLWRYHKPKGLVTTHRDPEGRPTVFAALPEHLPRVISVGRLDVNTEGLLLLTNDGALARHLELPATGWLRRYRARAHGSVTPAALEALKAGSEIDGSRYGPIAATLDKTQGANVWLTLALREGKNREVRTVLESLGLTVNRLIRISFGPFQLLELAPGEVDVVRRRVLVDQLGPQVARELGLSLEPRQGQANGGPGRSHAGADRSRAGAGRPYRKQERR